jgi:hypothetical protein
MIGLWGPSTIYGRDFRRSHLAFAVSLEELLTAGRRLRRNRVICQDFNGKQTDEPSVIGWMPSAQLYLRFPRAQITTTFLRPQPRLASSRTRGRAVKVGLPRIAS